MAGKKSGGNRSAKCKSKSASASKSPKSASPKSKKVFAVVQVGNGVKPASGKSNKSKSTAVKSPIPAVVPLPQIDRPGRIRRNEIAALLQPGPGLLQRAQQVNRTIGGFQITPGTISKLPTLAEQAEKAVSARTPDRIRILLQDPYNQVSVITEHLGLTGVGGLVAERMRLFNYPVSCVVSATWETPMVKLNGVESYRVPVADSKDEQIGAYFDEVTELLEKVRQRNQAAIVHCMAGASRSATLVMAYLIRYQGKTLEEAYRHVKKCRSLICPNLGFLQQLAEFERKCKPEPECSRWSQFTLLGVSKWLPQFIIDDFLEDYEYDFEQH